MRECVKCCFFVCIFKNVFIIYTQRKDHFVYAQFAPSKGKSPVSFRADRIEDCSKIHIYFLSLKPFPGKITFHGLEKKEVIFSAWNGALRAVKRFPFLFTQFLPIWVHELACECGFVGEMR